ncbi:hypothetical protein MYG64_35430 (plasmid) [Ensifer adhaerens]|uniref:hypothetical protein n=1 Tax=Ensifer adhaerens TaxID=106592 RepID=UPI0021011EB1|nr:hypothetical protein [Ensifer adhaerens]UTV41811.1 hypothetical protein MYG64_35430 [Ensifer adhaerens]
MTPERFKAIVEAYGAGSDRWPLAERADAEAFATENPGVAEPVLRLAAGLDALLGGSEFVPASLALVNRIRAAASRKKHPSFRIWQGLGLLGFGLSGALAGAVAVTVLAPLASPVDLGKDGYVLTAFGELSLASDEEAGQ